MMTEPDFDPTTESFSAGYDIVHNADVRTYGYDEAIMDFDMFEALAKRFGDPVVGLVEGIHYYFKPERSIPAESLAVPEDNHGDPSAFLIQK